MSPDVNDPPDAWDKTAAWIARHGALPALGVLTIALAILYSQTFRGEPVGDDLTFHFAEAARLADCLRAGDWDFWNPSANGGFASLYYYQSIPQLASAVPTALFGNHLFWFQLSVMLPHVLAPAAAYRGMRLMGATPWEAFVAAAAVAFMNGESRWGAGATGTYAVGLYTQSWALAALPLALGHGARFVTEQKSLAPAIAWGTFVWMCHPFVGVSLGVILMAAFAALAVLQLTDGTFRWIGRALGPEPNAGPLEAALAHVVGRWQAQPPRPLRPELVRSCILGVALLVAWAPIYVPLFVDYEGFGGFPHRVNDEVGPGFAMLADWYTEGKLLDHGDERVPLLTIALPFVLVFARAPFLRWMWAPALVFALCLGIGPHIGKTSSDDLFPAVRFLGTMQVLLALAIGAGAIRLGRVLWNVRDGTLTFWTVRIAFSAAVAGIIAFIVAELVDGDPDGIVVQLVDRLAFGLDFAIARWIVLVAIAALGFLALPMWRALGTQYGQRTGLMALAAACCVLLVSPGWKALDAKLWVLADYPSENPGAMREEIFEVNAILAAQPPARKQSGPGTENHWWNLLSYVYDRVPSLLQMGGGGLQASPNYDFVWSVRDFKKLAWVYDAPYVIFTNAKASEIPAGETIAKTPTHEVRKLPAEGLVSAVHVTGMLPEGSTRAGTKVRAAAIAWLRSDDPYANKHLAYPGYSTPSAPPAAKVVRAWRQDSRSDAPDIIAEVEVTTPTVFVARESWHPRWRAFVDGKPVKVGRVTPDFPAALVPAGKHVLAFRFDRPWWAHAAWLAWPLMTLLGWLGLRRYERR